MNIKIDTQVRIAVCDIKGVGCGARTYAGTIDTVYQLPGMKVVKACGSCFKGKVDAGEWVLPAAV